MLQQYLLVFNEQSKILCQRLNDVCDSGKMVDIFHFIGDMNVIAVTRKTHNVKLSTEIKNEAIRFTTSRR